MAIRITPEQAQMFLDNGFSKDKVRASIEHYRSSGLTDDEIQTKINDRLSSFANSAPVEAPEEPQETEKMSFKEFWSATPEERNEQRKAIGRERLQKRQEWEQNHPVISEIQKTFEPGYRRELIDMQNQAEYGSNVPLDVALKSGIKGAGYDLGTGLNWAVGLATGGAGNTTKFLPSVARASAQGAAQGGVEGLTSGLADEGLSLEALNRGLKGATTGATVGAAVPFVGKPIEFVTDLAGKVAKGALRGTGESVGISKNAFDRILKSPRGAELSEKSDTIGSQEFITGVAERFKDGVQKLRNQEVANFAKARDALLAENKDTTMDLLPYTQKAFEEIKKLGFVDDNGLTPAGKNATNLTKFLEDLEYYSSRNFDIGELQTLKSDVLDNIIDYTPQAGQKLNNSTRALQRVAKNMRKGINEALNNKLGSEYGAINKKLSDVLDIVDNNPEIKDLTNANSLDTLTNKLKRTGTTRTQAGKELQKLEKIMNENGIQISDYSLMDDILDHNTAKEIDNRINTGLFGGVANIARRAAAQPVLEGIVKNQDALTAFLNGIQNVGRKIKPVSQVMQSPNFYSGLAVPTMLQGGVEYNDYR